MRSPLTAYTSRCSSVILRDHAPARTYFSGSGFPMPWKGSRMTASTRSRTRSATRRFVSTQKRRSWRNSGWKTGSRSGFFAKAEVSSELVDGLRLQPSATSALQGREQPFRILRGPQQVRCFRETFEFIGRHERHVPSTAAADNHGLSSLSDVVAKRGKVCSRVGVGGFLRHLILPYRIPVRSQLSHVKQPNELGLLVARQEVRLEQRDRGRDKSLG